MQGRLESRELRSMGNKVSTRRVLVAGESSAESNYIFELTGDFDLGSEPIVFVSMTFYSKRAVISTVFMEVPRGSMRSSLC